MKKLMSILLLTISSLTFAQETKSMDRDSLILANMLLKPSTQKCIEQVQQQNQGQFMIEKIIKSEVPDSTKYEIQGVLLVGGDVATGYATIDVSGSFEPFFGFVYRCSVRK